MSVWLLIGFAFLWIGLLYAYNSLLARQFIHWQPRKLVLYISMMALIGLFGEIFLDSAYNFFVGNPLWRYNILPIHGAYTSAYALVTWGIYGMHLSWFHGTLEKWKLTHPVKLALIFCFEALLFEAMLTISARYILGDFMYYYYPGDLWHVSSFQNMPFYFICGLVVIKTIERFRTDPKFFIAMSWALLSVLVFLT